ncbi:uncharacterized protein [Branchiostoma lanceolatum]|uniref:uncharacterized protein n=1 Tax=Branchiostoma lanceolatum TaxID=7740 RepID=UPI00345488FA
MKRVTGTIIQGRLNTEQRVTSYKLQYSMDGIIWTAYAGSDDSEMDFAGNVDRSTPVTNLLNNPVDARYVRFLPQTWNHVMSMRAEIVGCNTTAVLPCLYLLGMESGAIPDDSITASSVHYEPGYEPYRGRLYGVAGEGAWRSKYNRIGEWLQVDLGEMKRVTGTIIQGWNGTDNWVTSYKLQYSTDRITWTTYAGSDESDMIFQGNVDSSTPVTNLLNNPVDARYVRFVVQSRTILIAMRVEIVGCYTTAVPPACPYMLGMESGAIPDGSITASSFGNSYEPYHGRSNGASAWMAKSHTIGEWLQVDLGEMKRVMGTIIRARPNTGMWVFPGNVDRYTPVTNLLNNPVDARYVRFLPQTWESHVSMGVEIVGCNTTAVPPACPYMLGMESGEIPDGSITATSFWDPDFDPCYGRLNGVAGGGAWLPSQGSIIGQWLQVFSGNVYMNTPVTNLLNNSVDARYVRFVVQSYNRNIAMRVEIVGCNTTAVPPACPYMLGMESGAIPDGSITASSVHYEPGYEPYRGRLNGVAGGGAWIASQDSIIGQWLQVFPGNVYRNTPVTNLLNNPVDARYVRFLILSWLGIITMRAEIVGCNTTAVPPACPYMLGMESGAIPDESITSPSGFAYRGRLNGVADGGAWIPYNIIGQWLQVFPGNVYMNTPVTNLLNNSVDARYVRFVILSRLDRIAMRAEIVGCDTNAVIPVCPHMFGMESGAIPDDRITASSFQVVGSEAYLGRLHGVAVVGAWVSKYNSIGEWLQVNLGEMKLVMGTIIQGRPTDDQLVTSYKLQYGLDGITWTTYAGSDGSEMVFPGNVDRYTPVTNLLDNPIDASYVRFLPQTWHGQIAMRAEIVGCHTTCIVPLGMESGAIPDDSITASSHYGTSKEPYRGRLNGVAGVGGWVGGWTYNFNIGQWLQVFPGNVDKDTPVTNLLNNPVDTRYVRFVVQSYQQDVAMRAEILGCNITAVLLPACPRMLGMESGAIPDVSITASTLHNPGDNTNPYHGRLNGVAGGGAWVPTPRSIVGQWLQVAE